MAKKATDQKIDALTTIVTGLAKTIEKSFASVADDIADIKRDMATKDQFIKLHTQVNSIEHQLRETRTEIRLGNLEEKVFGTTRT